jgi:hypothetical protein
MREPCSTMRAKRLLLGILAANGVGLLLCVVANWIPLSPGAMLMGSIPSMLLVSVCMGLAAAWVWRPLQLGIGATLFYSLICTFIALIAAVIAFQEGAICLIIISPIIYCGILTGALAGRTWFQPRRDRLNAFLAPVFALVVVVEPALRSPHASVVIDELHIDAPPDKVWPHVLAFRPISSQPSYWLFQLGLPYPVETANAGNFVGADRACHFSAGAVFKEKVAGIEPGRLLTFDIVEMPPHPELLGHLDATRGQFELRDNGDGTTTLFGRTWYSLHVRPGWYFDWWTHDIFRAVHLRVMLNIKQLAEAAP